MEGKPAGWYPDDKVSTIERYWGGEQWEDRWRPNAEARRGYLIENVGSVLMLGTAAVLVLGGLFWAGSCVASSWGDHSGGSDAEVECRLKIDRESTVPVDISQGQATGVDGRWEVYGYYDTPFDHVRYRCVVDGDQVTIQVLP